MNQSKWVRHVATAVAVAVAVASAASCGDPVRLDLEGDASAPTRPNTPSLVDNAVNAPDPSIDSGNTVVGQQCPLLACPPPYATCAGPTGQLPPYECTTNLDTTLFHCGECGNDCGNGNQVGMLIDCVGGKCVGTCEDGRLDCNGILDDGCEIALREDEQNCGSCGNQCEGDVQCVEGQCGCPAGLITCSDFDPAVGTTVVRCVDATSDDFNCGSCDFSCLDNQPADASVPPPNSYYGCREGLCQDLKCRTRDPDPDVVDQVFFADCNGDLTEPLGNGCEIDLLEPGADGFLDPSNCGQCGRQCDPGQKCGPQLAPSFSDPGGQGIDCLCPPGQTLCDGICGVLEDDPRNCGSCDYACPSPPLSVIDGHVDPICERGRCGTACKPTFGDCNQRLDDGCEAPLLNDPRNCGGCGVQCDVAAGQPCVNGACATQLCDGPPR